MDTEKFEFNDVTLLITHYNRSSSLEHLLNTFRNLKCTFTDIVVSDDGSRPEHLDKIKALQSEFPFRLVTSPKNMGLGHNLNKGQDAVNTAYTLYVQEDFEPQSSFPENFQYALTQLNQRTDLDIVRFYSYIKYPYLKPYGNGFSEMYIPPLARNYKKVYYYSDHPHLRRSTFFQRFGRYKEGITGDRCEYKMCISFIKNKGKGLFYNNYKDLFYQKNTSEEPSTMTRSKWTQSKNPVIFYIRELYRQIKYNYDILF